MDKTYKFICMFVITILLIGCASTGVIPIGKDTYTISKQSATGYESAVGIRGQVLKEAMAFCEAHGLKMIVVSLDTKDGIPGRSYATADLVFRAVRSDDPEYRRLNLKRRPDQKIEVNSEIKLKDKSKDENGMDIYNDLLKLDDLRKRGILTEKEFNEQKAKLLNNK